MEDIIEETNYPLDTPEIIRKVAVKRTEIYREGPNRTTGNVIIEPAQVPSIPPEFLSTVTDTEDMEGSAAEDFVDEAAAPSSEVLLQGDQTKVTQSEEFDRGKEMDEMHTKESLLYPLNRPDAHTDIESLEDVEGNNRCACRVSGY